MSRRLAARLRSLSLNVEAAKARAAHWELAPSIEIRPRKETQGMKDRQGMTTFNTFDPGMTRPLLMNDLTLSASSIKEDISHLTAYSASELSLLHPFLMSGYLMGFHRSNTLPFPKQFSSLTRKDEAVARQSDTPAVVRTVVKPENKLKYVVAKPFKPWPYNLPQFLRPQPGTTFWMMHNVVARDNMPKRIGFLQAVLYGTPEPMKLSFRVGLVRKGGMLHEVLYGVKENDVTFVTKTEEKEDREIGSTQS
ncbi:hypothetical protein GQ44DRAFT_731839 [Phaeosphaeriaceae sp. PMI808]|nr:hypothetical protein GQ44DRAFT_731839 [Phaeosphaeriaceae sp. PMI808]